METSQQERVSRAPDRLQGVTVCGGTGCWGRAFRDCLRLSMGHLGEEPKVGKGRYQWGLGRNKHVTIEG